MRRAPAGALLALALALAGPAAAQPAAPEELEREVRLSVRVEGDGRDVRLELPLAQSDGHQEILDEQLVLRGFTSEEVRRDGNRLAVLTYPKLTGRKRVTYVFRVRTRRTGVPVAPVPVVEEPAVAPEDRTWLRPTRHLQSSSPLIRERLVRYAVPRMAAGETDAIRLSWDLVATGYVHRAGGSKNVLKATRTGVAGDRGLDRLLATFLRTSGVPARPVGGLDIAKEKGKRSLTWVEAKSGGRWVSLSVPRGLWGELPAGFVKLWHGDRPLAVREGAAKLSYRIKVKVPDAPPAPAPAPEPRP